MMNRLDGVDTHVDKVAVYQLTQLLCRARVHPLGHRCGRPRRAVGRGHSEGGQRVHLDGGRGHHRAVVGTVRVVQYLSSSAIVSPADRLTEADLLGRLAMAAFQYETAAVVAEQPHRVEDLHTQQYATIGPHCHAHVVLGLPAARVAHLHAGLIGTTRWRVQPSIDERDGAGRVTEQQQCGVPVLSSRVL